MAVIQTPDYFGNAFAQSFAQSRMMAERDAERKREEERLRQSLQVIAGTDAPLPVDTVNRQVQVQTPTAPLQGGSSMTTQPSAPTAPIQTQTETATLPVKDPYKEGLKNIELEYREKMKNLAQISNPQLAMSYVSQAMKERDLAKAEHNSATFQTGLMEIMNNPDMSTAQKIGRAVQLNGQLKAGFKVPEIFAMFEKEKPDLRVVGGSLVQVGRNGVQELYRAPEKPEKPGITFADKTFKDEEGREYQLDSRGQRHYVPKPVSPKDTRLAEINDAEKRELEYLRLQSSQNKFPTPADVKAMEAKAREIQAKYSGMREGLKQPKQTADKTSSLGDPLLDAALAEVRLNGADTALQKLTAKFGAEKARQILGQISLSIQEN